MKIVTWNCNGAFRRKYHLADNFDADVYVIQECENPEESSSEYREWAAQYIWSGKSGKKGLGVFVKKGVSVTALGWPDHGLKQFLPVRINEFNLLAVWTKNSRSMAYIGQFWQYFQYYQGLLNTTTIVCGDFNSNSIWDRRGRIWNHSECVLALGRLGLTSVYHGCTGEQQGDESQPTFYLHRNIEKPYHIDYFFASPELVGPAPVVAIGCIADWLTISDHMPVTLTI